MEKVKVSVIIPVYNAEPFLDDCLQTLLAQTLKEIEIICVNDGSKDRSLEILRRYEETDERMRVIDQENQGAGAARNAGLSIAKGEYLSFLDSDDFYERNMLERAYETAKNADADVCVFDADLYDVTTKSYRPCTWAFRRQYFTDREVFCPQDSPYNENIFRMFNGWPWDKLFKREFIEREGLLYQNLRTTNDMYFVFMALAKAKRVIPLDECLIHQRVNVGTSLSRTREKSWNCFYLGLQAMHEELKKSGMDKTFKKAFLNWTVNFSLWQLNNMKGVAYCNTYRLLKDVAFEEFGVTKAKESDFYSQVEYNQYASIMNTSLDEVLMNRIETLENENAKLQKKTDKLKKKVERVTNSKSYKLGNAVKKILHR